MINTEQTLQNSNRYTPLHPAYRVYRTTEILQVNLRAVEVSHISSRDLLHNGPQAVARLEREMLGQVRLMFNQSLI